MQLQDLYFVVITDKIKECKDFYTRWLGFKVLFEASWFIYLASQREHSQGEHSQGEHSQGEHSQREHSQGEHSQGEHSQGEHSFGLAFMSPEHPSSPPDPERYNGNGSFITLQVENVTTEFQRLRDAGLEIPYKLKDEPWGQRRFGLYDPAGMWVDVIEQIDPQTGFWDQYFPGA
jgi:catechol 2,3-dioxygenase-like lactoylglutathione lyase family enzyme